MQTIKWHETAGDKIFMEGQARNKPIATTHLVLCREIYSGTPTVNIWMVNPSVSSKLKVRYIGMKLSNFCFVSSLPTYRCSVKRISENFALLFLRILAWTSVWPFGKFANWESQFTIESWSLLNCKFEFFGKCISRLSLRPVGWWRLSTFQQFIVWKMPNNYEQFIEWQF